MNRTIHTEIEIEASADKVWNILSDFEKFPEWNPFITAVYGRCNLDEEIKIDVQMGSSRKIQLDAKISMVVPNEELVWGGGLPFGAFTGEHFYRIEPISENSIKFIHGENLSGWLVRFIWLLKGRQLSGSYVLMNEALKSRAEGTE